LLNAEGIEFTYREYTKEPLSEAEIREVLGKLGQAANTVVRKRDKAFKELGLTGTESDSALIPLMAKHPTLLERPIGVVGDRAVVGRPPANLLELV
jgi:arsenate reductase